MSNRENILSNDSITKNSTIKSLEKITNLQENVMNIQENLINEKKSKTILQENIVKKKILFVTRPIAPPWDEASKNFAYHLAINLAKINSNMEIHLMTKGSLSELPNNIVQHPIYTASKNDFSLPQKIRSLLFQWQIKNEFDIVHYFFTPSKLNSWLIKNFLYPHKSKTIQTIATLREDLMNEKEVKNNLFGDILVTYSTHTKSRLKKLGFSNTQHIYPGIDLENYTPQEKNEEFMKECNILPTDFVISFAGEYVRLGGIDEVITSFIKIHNEIPNVKLWLSLRVKNTKDNIKKKEVVNQFKRLGLLEKVIFGDEVNYTNRSMSDVYNLHDIIIYPIHNMKGKFDVPLVIPEAMACQKPVILSDIPLLREFVNNNNAIIIKIGDIDQLTEAILDLYNNPKKREQIATNGMRYARKSFDIGYIAKQYNQLYEEI